MADTSPRAGDGLRYARVFPARGTAEGRYRTIVVRLDPETFEKISARAAAVKTSMAEEVRTLLTWGLEADEGNG